MTGKSLSAMLRRASADSVDDLRTLASEMRRRGIYAPLQTSESTFFRIRRKGDGQLFSDGKVPPAFVGIKLSATWDSVTTLGRHLAGVGRFGGGISKAYGDCVVAEYHVNIVSERGVNEAYRDSNEARAMAEKARKQLIAEERLKRKKEENIENLRLTALVESAMSIDDLHKMLLTTNTEDS